MLTVSQALDHAQMLCDAATKAGAVVVNTMPMLRASELAKIVDKAEITLALCDTRIKDDLVACAITKDDTAGLPGAAKCEVGLSAVDAYGTLPLGGGVQHD